MAMVADRPGMEPNTMPTTTPPKRGRDRGIAEIQ
jgi:hypothetical protein